MLSQLFETKGSNKTFEFFNEIISEFYHKLNFYNVRVEQRQFTSIYESPITERVYYLDADGSISNEYVDETGAFLNEQDAGFFIDDTIGYKIFPKIYEREHRVDFYIKLYEPAKKAIKIKLNYTDEVIIDKDLEEITISTKKYDIYDKSIRNEDQLVYKLEPVLINDPLAIIEEVDAADLRTSKYLMQRFDYFNTDTRNTSPTNVFPIITNVLYIQFGTSETMDNMVYYPDLVRMFAMTTTQDEVFSFSIDGATIKITMQEYVNLLMYIKLREIEFNNPGWVWGENRPVQALDFTTMVYPKEKLDEIYNLILYYRDMRHDHDTFIEFKRRLNTLTGAVDQISSTKIFNMTQFNEYLAGNIPDNFAEFFIMLDEFYPDGVDIISGKDQNKLLKEKVTFIYETYNPLTPRELFNLIAIQDVEYIGLNNSLYDMLKLQFIDKYPRVVQKIDALNDSADFLEVFLNNYKRMLVEVTKMDNFVTYFVNDTFKRFLLTGAFKDEFFDPVVDLFQQYFFKAELSYQNSDAIIHINRDKMQQVTCGTDQAYLVELEGYFSEISPQDKIGLRNIKDIEEDVVIEDSWNIEIINDTDGVDSTFLFSDIDDSGYMDGLKI